MEMTPDDRRRFADCLLREQNSRRFDGKKKAAYTAANVSQATWENAINQRPMTDQKIRQIVIHLWPDAEGDWRKIPGIEPPVEDSYDALLEELERAPLSPENKATIRAAIEADRDSGPPPASRKRSS